jgi:hypothetical protein
VIDVDVIAHDKLYPANFQKPKFRIYVSKLSIVN